MGYYEQSVLSRDADFRERIAACYATQMTGGTGDPGMESRPLVWAEAYQYRLAAAPGFADAYTYAINTGVENPGRDPAVITDEQILAAVQSVMSGV